MQQHFDFVSGDLARWRAMLAPPLAATQIARRRTPIGQLVKSLISGRTRDAVSLAAYHRLGERFCDAAGIAAADSAAVEAAIADVTFAEAKAAWLIAALRIVERERLDFRLDFLGDMSLAAALAWLENLPGVGRKVAASTLNASTLRRPVFIVDSHVLRVLSRLGFVGPSADARAASEAVTAAMPRWCADDFLLFHMAVKRLGQTICRFDVPACALCPLADECPSRAG